MINTQLKRYRFQLFTQLSALHFVHLTYLDLFGVSFFLFLVSCFLFLVASRVNGSELNGQSVKLSVTSRVLTIVNHDSSRLEPLTTTKQTLPFSSSSSSSSSSITTTAILSSRSHTRLSYPPCRPKRCRFHQIHHPIRPSPSHYSTPPSSL